MATYSIPLLFVSNLGIEENVNDGQPKISFNHKKLLVWFLLLAIGAPIAAQQQKPADPVAGEPTGETLSVAAGKVPGKTNGITAAAVSSAFGSAKSDLGAYRVSSVNSGNNVYLVVSVEFKTVAARAAYRDREATVYAANETFADVFLASEAAFDRLMNNPQVVWAESHGAISVPRPPLLAIAPASKLIAEPVVRGGLDGYTGKGVIIAVVDTGIDFRHPDFITTDAAGNPTSRLLYFWDTFNNPAAAPGLTAPLKYPNGVSVGTLYSRAQLNQDLRSGARRIFDPDSNSHGTAAAGIAAGNGRGSNGRWVGVAPEADLIGVKIGNAQGLMQSYLLNAITQWLFRVAQTEGKALVISCSFGGQHGPHSGETILERHLSSHFGIVPGRVMFVAAGNERTKGLHAKIRFGGANQPGLLAWCADGSSTIEMYFASFGGLIDPRDLAFEPLPLKWPPGLNSGCGAPASKFIEGNSPMTVNRLTREAEFQLDVAPGPAGIRVFSRSGRSYLLDAYVEGSDIRSQSRFYNSIGVGQSRMEVLFHAEQVSTPGTARYVMTIGSYDWNDQFDGETQPSCGQSVLPGQLSCYSNPGYSRGAVIKPEIVAPGQFWTSSNARHSNGTLVEPEGSDRSGNYRIFNGTSAATPYAAGIAALMMQKNPRLTMLDIKNYFMRNATADAKTGKVPNFDWGYGKLDLAAARRILAAVPAGAKRILLQPAKKS